MHFGARNTILVRAAPHPNVVHKTLWLPTKALPHRNTTLSTGRGWAVQTGSSSQRCRPPALPHRNAALPACRARAVKAGSGRDPPLSSEDSARGDNCRRVYADLPRHWHDTSNTVSNRPHTAHSTQHTAHTTYIHICVPTSC